jgi:hypothetical protein
MNARFVVIVVGLCLSSFHEAAFRPAWTATRRPRTRLRACLRGAATRRRKAFPIRVVLRGFRDKQYGTVDDLTKNLRGGLPMDLPPIEVVRYKGLLWSLDNRRLYAFQRAGVAVRYKIVSLRDPRIAKKFRNHFTTDNHGTSVRVKP